MSIVDVVIVGAGPAGIACAIQLKRWGLDPVLFEKAHVGGLLVNANLVENYPGFPGGIRGTALVERFERQLKDTGAGVTFEPVLGAAHDGRFVLTTPEGEMTSRFMVVASGTRPKKVHLPEITAEVADRVFYEVHPVSGFEGRQIAIVGAGDAAFDYALNLGRHNEVTILNRKAERKCLPLLWERASRVPGITYRENTVVASVRASGDGLVLSGGSPSGHWELRVDCAIFAIGRGPELGFLSESLQGRMSQLEADGWLYFVGDVKNDIYRQASIAVGDGVRAAMQICEKLRRSD